MPERREPPRWPRLLYPVALREFPREMQRGVGFFGHLYGISVPGGVRRAGAAISPVFQEEGA